MLPIFRTGYRNKAEKMTTAAEVKGWPGPLLAQRDDLILRKRHLIMRPVRHVLRSIYFFSSSWDRTHPEPVWYMDFLPSPTAYRGRQARRALGARPLSRRARCRRMAGL